MTTPSVEHTVDTADSILRTLDLDYEIDDWIIIFTDRGDETYRGRWAPGDREWRANKQRNTRDDRLG